MAGTSISGTLLSPLVVKLITNYGWRQTYVYLAIVMFLIMVPATIFIVRPVSFLQRFATLWI